MADLTVNVTLLLVPLGVTTLMEKLPAKDRALVERCYGRHTTIKQVADELRRPVDTIYKSLRRIRSTLLGCVTRVLAAEERA